MKKQYKKGTKNQLADKIISFYWDPFLFLEATGQSLIWWPHFSLLLPLQANSAEATSFLHLMELEQPFTSCFWFGIFCCRLQNKGPFLKGSSVAFVGSSAFWSVCSLLQSQAARAESLHPLVKLCLGHCQSTWRKSRPTFARPKDAFPNLPTAADSNPSSHLTSLSKALWLLPLATPQAGQQCHLLRGISSIPAHVAELEVCA